MKKKKFLKAAAFCLAAALLIYLLYFANALVGNPLSKALSTHTAKKYLQENYADVDFYVDRVSYSFKTGCYYANIKAPDSLDKHFTVCLDFLGRVLYDDYTARVENAQNTGERLGNQYREMIDTVLTSPAYPYRKEVYIGYGELAFGDIPYGETTDTFPVIEEKLVIDQLYNISKLGEQAGYLTLYIDTEEELNIELAAEMLLQTKRCFDEAGVPFYAIEFVLEHPMDETLGKRPEGEIRIRRFRSADIYESGLQERLAKAHEETLAYYARLDAQEKP